MRRDALQLYACLLVANRSRQSGLLNLAREVARGRRDVDLSAELRAARSSMGAHSRQVNARLLATLERTAA